MASWFALVLIGGLLIWGLIAGIRGSRKLMVCKQCESVDYPKYVTRGSLGVEIALWIFFIIPGLIYSLWRQGAKRIPTCKHCGSREMVPVDSPAGRKIVNSPAAG